MDDYRLEAKVDRNNEYYFEAEDGEIFRDPEKAIIHNLENKESFKEKYNPEIIRITPSHYPKITAKIKQLLGDDCIKEKK